MAQTAFSKIYVFVLYVRPLSSGSNRCFWLFLADHHLVEICEWILRRLSDTLQYQAASGPPMPTVSVCALLRNLNQAISLMVPALCVEAYGSCWKFYDSTISLGPVGASVDLRLQPALSIRLYRTLNHQRAKLRHSYPESHQPIGSRRISQ